jgi:hypothetical protein
MKLNVLRGAAMPNDVQQTPANPDPGPARTPTPAEVPQRDVPPGIPSPLPEQVPGGPEPIAPPAPPEIPATPPANEADIQRMFPWNSDGVGASIGTKGFSEHFSGKACPEL